MSFVNIGLTYTSMLIYDQPITHIWHSSARFTTFIKSWTVCSSFDFGFTLYLGPIVTDFRNTLSKAGCIMLCFYLYMRTMMSTMRATMEAPTPTPTWASRGNVDCAWLSYCTLPREKFRLPIFTWKTQVQKVLTSKKDFITHHPPVAHCSLNTIHSLWTQADCSDPGPVSCCLLLEAAGPVVHSINGCGWGSSLNTPPHRYEPPPHAWRWLDPGSHPEREITYKMNLLKNKQRLNILL